MSFLSTILEHLASSGPSAPDAVIEVRADEGLVPFSRAVLSDLLARARTTVAGHIQPGDRVALLAPNSARWVACDLAILAEGGISVPLYARQDPKELAVMLADSAPTLLIAATDELAESITSAWPEHCPILRFAEVFAAEPTELPARPLEDDTRVTIIYTSGTSGVPKGVVYSAANVNFMLPTTQRALAQLAGETTGPDKVFHFLPLCFAGSRIMLWTQLLRGNPIMLSTDLTRLVDEIKLADPNYYLNVPAVLERIRRGVGDVLSQRGGMANNIYSQALEADRRLRDGRGTLKDKMVLGAAKQFVFPKIKETIGPSLRFLICGSAPLSPETQHWFELLGISVFQVYGLTETTAIVTMDKPGEVDAGKVGHAIDGVEAKLTEERELITRGPHIFQEYWNKPEATAEAIVDGWFHTGDEAEVDRHGNWRIVGRVKNILVPESGHNVPPEPIEEKLRDACALIEHAFLVGHARPYLSVIVTGDVNEQTLQLAIDEVNQGLPHYKRIRRFYIAPEPFTPENGLLTANQKLRRKVITKHFAEAIEEMYL